MGKEEVRGTVSTELLFKYFKTNYNYDESIKPKENLSILTQKIVGHTNGLTYTLKSESDINTLSYCYYYKIKEIEVIISSEETIDIKQFEKEIEKDLKIIEDNNKRLQ